jgi:uncharacterized protein
LKKSNKFIFWTFLCSFLYAAVFYYGFRVRGGYPYLAVATGYMWIPALVSIVLTKKEGRRLKDLGIVFRPNRWFIFAWMVFLVLSAVSIPVNTAFPGAGFSINMEGFFEKYRELLSPEQFDSMRKQALDTPWIPLIMMVFQGLIAGITINAFFGFGEELGWRGYLYKEYEGLGFWKNSFYTGLAWGFWHAPFILQGHNYPGYPVIGVFMMVLWCLLLSPVFTLIRMNSGSVIAAAIGHGTLNAVAGISIVYITGGHILLNGLLGFSGFTVLAAANLCIWFYLTREKHVL